MSEPPPRAQVPTDVARCDENYRNLKGAFAVRAKVKSSPPMNCTNKRAAIRTVQDLWQLLGLLETSFCLRGKSSYQVGSSNPVVRGLATTEG